jgi:hypothetical protein
MPRPLWVQKNSRQTARQQFIGEIGAFLSA